MIVTDQSMSDRAVLLVKVVLLNSPLNFFQYKMYDCDHLHDHNRDSTKPVTSKIC